jgi:hypothetical protein
MTVLTDISHVQSRIVRIEQLLHTDQSWSGRDRCTSSREAAHNRACFLDRNSARVTIEASLPLVVLYW